MGLWGNIGVFSDVMGYSGVGNGWTWDINLTLCRGLKKQYKSRLKAWRTCLDRPEAACTLSSSIFDQANKTY